MRAAPFGARAALVALAAVASFVIASALLWDPPWNSVFIDDFTRTLHAMDWADDPYWAEPGLMWLPGHSYVLGLFLMAVGESTNPLTASAILNTLLMVGSASLAAATSWVVFRSRSATVLVLVVALVAPWTHRLALSGLAEPLYISGVSLGLFGMARWLELRSDGRLAMTASGFLVAGLVRFEGWVMWATWFVVVLVLIRRRSSAGGRRLLRPLAIAAVPAIVPLWWSMASLRRFGDPLAFLDIYRTVFASGLGGDLTFAERVLFYPVSLFASDPVLAILVAISALLAWTIAPGFRPVIAVPALSFLALWGVAVVTRSVGFPPERFLHGFLLALAWTTGAPAVWALQRRRWALVVGGLVAVAMVVAGASRWSDRIEEWTYAPDLLELAATLSEQDGLEVAVPIDLVNEDAPIRVLGAGRLDVESLEPDEVSAAVTGVPGNSVVIDRLPERLAGLPQPDRVVGRYSIFGDSAHDIRGFRSVCGDCSDWVLIDERGQETSVARGTPMLVVAFTGTRAGPGERAVLKRSVAIREGMGTLEVFPLYGRGFNRGRLTVEVAVDGQTVFRRDAAEPGGWQRVALPFAGDCAVHEVAVAVIASEAIEPNWGWGRATDTLVRSIDLGEECATPSATRSG